MTENKMEIVAGKCPIEAGGNCPLRPQGEWIIIGDTVCECPQCKHQQTFLLSPKESNVNFCEKCGADMRGEEE